ncbi:HNH endonuclease [Bacillus sp. 1P10SD]|uniref:HNH endonuclease n=1 Tax=Bacillus sp. 1P10SD TaxID=3132265 RepID=UPI0039A6CC07
MKKVGDWTFPEIDNLLGRREITKSTFIGVWGLPKQLHNEFRQYELGGGLYIDFLGKSYPARITDTLANLNLDFSASYLQDEIAELLKEEKEILFSNYIKRERKRLPKSEKVYIDLFKEPYKIEGVERPGYNYVLKIHRQQPESDKYTKDLIKGIDEEEIEKILNSNMSNEEFDKWLEDINSTAELRLKEGIKKIRLYQKKVIKDLKFIYKGCCQICGYSTLKEYRIDISEAHHIQHFSKTCDNSPQNIIILCPNHHRLLHRVDFNYHREEQQFTFGKTVLKIQFDKHLK